MVGSRYARKPNPTPDPNPDPNPSPNPGPNPNHRDVDVPMRSTWYAVLSRITVLRSNARLSFLFSLLLFFYFLFSFLSSEEYLFLFFSLRPRDAPLPVFLKFPIKNTFLIPPQVWYLELTLIRSLR